MKHHRSIGAGSDEGKLHIFGWTIASHHKAVGKESNKDVAENSLTVADSLGSCLLGGFFFCTLSCTVRFQLRICSRRRVDPLWIEWSSGVARKNSR